MLSMDRGPKATESRRVGVMGPCDQKAKEGHSRACRGDGRRSGHGPFVRTSDALACDAADPPIHPHECIYPQNYILVCKYALPADNARR